MEPGRKTVDDLVKDIQYLLDYYPETGIFRWKVRQAPRIPAGSLAGTKHKKDGYWRITLYGKSYLAHRLAWLYTYGKWPEKDIDHINGSKTDNRISNLRDVNRSVNCMNKKFYKNKSGIPGVRQLSSGNYNVRVMTEGKHVTIGTFDTEQEAREAYLSAKAANHTRGGQSEF